MSINTVNTKFEQLSNGYFSVGSGSETILIVGSCRAVPYAEYLNKWNTDNRFTVCFIDPFNFHFDLRDNRVDFEKVMSDLEKDERLLSLFKRTNIFIHEFYSNFGMFNCSKWAEKSIYHFGMNPQVDICTPNWNDIFILFSDIVSFDVDMRKKATADYNVIGKLSEETQQEIYVISQRNLQKFYDVCLKSDIPEMKQYFQENFTKKRFWHTFNHVSKHFTLGIFKFIISKWLHLEMTPELWNEISKEDMFDSHYTRLTKEDVRWYGFQWGENLADLRDKL